MTCLVRNRRLTESNTGLKTLSTADMSADDDTWSVSTAVVEGDTGAWVRLISVCCAHVSTLRRQD